MRRTMLPPGVRNNRNVVCGGQGPDVPQLAESSTPSYVGLPNVRRMMFQKQPEAVTGVLVLARRDQAGFDLLVQPAKTLIVIGLQALLHPIDAVRRHRFSEFDGIFLGERHPAVQHDVTVGPQEFTGPLDQFKVFVQPFATIRRTVGDRQLQPLEPESDVLLNIVSRAIGGDSGLRFSAEKRLKWHVQSLADDIPEGHVHCTKGVNDQALATVIQG